MPNFTDAYSGFYGLIVAYGSVAVSVALVVACVVYVKRVLSQ